MMDHQVHWESRDLMDPVDCPACLDFLEPKDIVDSLDLMEPRENLDPQAPREHLDQADLQVQLVPW